MEEDIRWKQHWEIFLEQMVYEKNKPSFIQAMQQLQAFSQKILE